MTRKIQITYTDNNNVDSKTTISYINTNLTNSQCYEFARRVISLTSNIFVEASIIDSTPAEGS